MKIYLLAFIAALCGGVIVSFAARMRGMPAAPPMDVIRTKELEILGKNSRPAARFGIVDGHAVLSFYADDLSPAIEIGSMGNPPFRFIRFSGREGKLVAAITTIPPDSHAALTLGDERWASDNARCDRGYGSSSARAGGLLGSSVHTSLFGREDL